MNYKILSIILLCTVFLFKLLMTYLDKKSMQYPLKDNVKDIYDENDYQKWVNYKVDTMKIHLISQIIDFVFLLIFISFDIFAFFGKFSDNIYLQSILVLGSYDVLSTIVGIPTSYILTIKIETKYGFNQATTKTFVTDMIKELIVGCIISFGLTCLFIVLYVSLGNWILLAFTAVALGIVLCIAFLSPYFAKLFNKFTPLEEGSLRTKLTDLLDKHGYHVKDIKVMDGSRRSTKANAYFTGIGKTKTIVLYDTIISLMDEDELVAVFAHELAHGKYKHIAKSMMISVLQIFSMVFVIWGMLKLPVCADFGFEALNYGFVFVMALHVVTVFISLLIGLFGNYLRRKYEYEADAFAAKEGCGEQLISGLKKLAKNNFSSLTPHPVIVKLSYSHPPMSERIEAIHKEMEKAVM